MFVQNKSNHSIEAEDIVLNIGTNEVDPQAFEKFLKHPLIAKLDKQGVFVYEKSADKQLTVAEMEALIADTYDLETLEAIKSDDTRKGVQTAVDKQIEALKGE